MQQSAYSAPDGSYQTVALTMACHGATLVGILEKPAQMGRLGVVIVVGGPQYRVGSHRQFVELGREAARAGIPTLRFDHRGIGDSEGDQRPYYALNDDIRTAIDHLKAECPDVDGVVLWGLCDGATAALLYGNRDDRLAGMVLLNPWVESPRAQARSLLYYTVRRLGSPQFWRRLFRREVQLDAALRDLITNTYRTLAAPDSSTTSAETPGGGLTHEGFLGAELTRFPRQVLLILSGDDLTAETFRAVCRRSRTWQKALRSERVTVVEIAGADHTFSQPEWAARAQQETLQWLGRLAPRAAMDPD